MQDLPHRYAVVAATEPDANVQLSSRGLPGLESAPPAEYGGPGDAWSPETLLVAAVADCFVLSFKAIARASKLDWTSVSCDVEGVLDRQDNVTQFVSFRVRAVLEVPGGSDEAKAGKLLQKAENSCLITNSMKAPVHLEPEVRVTGT